MFETPRRWFRRNRTGVAVGAGLLGAAYFAGQYVLGKITETRQRMSDERIAREKYDSQYRTVVTQTYGQSLIAISLRRRFRQNQEDCTYTVLALLPTAAENTLRSIPVEDIIRELQSRKSDKRTRNPAGTDTAPSEAPSNLDDDDRSFTSSNYVHASQIATERAANSVEESSMTNIYVQKSKTQLWNQLKINCTSPLGLCMHAIAKLLQQSQESLH